MKKFTDTFWFWLLLISGIVGTCVAVTEYGYQRYIEEYEVQECVTEEPCFDTPEKYYDIKTNK